MKLAALLIALMACSAATSCQRHRPEPEPGVLSVSVESTSAWVRNFNPLGPGQPRWPTQAGIYEPLMIYNAMSGERVPWLAEGFSWSEDRRALTFELREGVRWSDGEAFDAEDVVFTFELLRDHKALDQQAIWSFVEGVEARGPHEVVVRFARVYVPGLDNLTGIMMVPEHVWSTVEDPVTFTNPNPVATGPFTEVSVFRNQVYELRRNPHYWQPGKPYIEGLRFLAYPSNDQANLALVDGSVDWAANFVPAVDRTYVARDPEHHDYWFPTFGSMIFLYLNTTHPHFGDVRVRKALSMAVNRERLVKIAMYDYADPPHPTGLSDAFASWRGEVGAGEQTWVGYDPEEARALLAEAGFTRDADGALVGPDGEPLEFVIDVVSGWSDWVRAGQVIVDELEALGVRARVRPSEFSAWFAKLGSGEFDAAISWSSDGATPYAFYRYLMAEATVVPEGERAPANWHRFGDARVDALLERFERSVDEDEQRRIIAEVAELFVELAPAVPLFPSPVWAAYSTERFTNFPTPENRYAMPSPNNAPDRLLVLTNLRPRGGESP